jgi:hypothetical protein
MNNKNKVVLGIYKTRSAVESAVDALKADGFSASDISVLMPERTGSQDFAHSKGTKAPEGAATGAGPIMAAMAGVGVGGAVGGVTGALVGLGIPEYEAKRYEGFVKKRWNIIVCSRRQFRRSCKSKKNVLKALALKIFLQLVKQKGIGCRHQL